MDPHHRLRIIEWLYQVAIDEKSIFSYTILHAIRIFDYITQIHDPTMASNKCQAHAIVCLTICSKIYDVNTITLEDATSQCDDAYSNSELVELELTLLADPLFVKFIDESRPLISRICPGLPLHKLELYLPQILSKVHIHEILCPYVGSRDSQSDQYLVHLGAYWTTRYRHCAQEPVIPVTVWETMIQGQTSLDTTRVFIYQYFGLLDARTLRLVHMCYWDRPS